MRKFVAGDNKPWANIAHGGEVNGVMALAKVGWDDVRDQKAL